MTAAQTLTPETPPQAPQRAKLQVLAIGALPLARYRLRRLVDRAADLNWLNSTNSVRAAAPMIAGLRPDIVILHGPPDANTELARRLTTAYSWLTLVVVVDDDRHAAHHAQALRDAGAHAVLALNTAPAALLAGIRLAHVTRQSPDPDPAQPPRGAASAERLSGRQHEVLALIADGNDNAQIGRTLYISTETVRSHVKEILRRLNARDRAHAVSVGFRTGLLGDTGNPRSGDKAR